MSSILTPLPDGMIPAAMRAHQTRGRRYAEAEHAMRSAFQRDRDRVVHSAHFRRLEYKTQVFVNGEGDNYRTRLTHTLEVTQIARSIARFLRLNEDLAEAAALSHDLGHTPFGHAGERMLDSLMKDEGGFNHNAQGLRIVDLLESRYPDFDGLNLTYEVREAFVRHGGPGVTTAHPEFPPDDAPLLEVAATLAADDIAYLAHDIDDGLYSGLLHEDQLAPLDLWQDAIADEEGFAAFPRHLKRAQGVRRLINLLVTDVVEQTKSNIVRKNVDSPDKARAEEGGLLAFSPGIEEKKNALKGFLFDNLYRHANVMRVMEEAQGMLREIWSAYASGEKKMPLQYAKIADISGMKRAATDYASGMTDRFAREEWARMSLSE